MLLIITVLGAYSYTPMSWVNISFTARIYTCSMVVGTLPYHWETVGISSPFQHMVPHHASAMPSQTSGKHACLGKQFPSCSVTQGMGFLEVIPGFLKRTKPSGKANCCWVMTETLYLKKYMNKITSFQVKALQTKTSLLALLKMSAWMKIAPPNRSNT